MTNSHTASLEDALFRLNDGDMNARTDVISIMLERFRTAASRMLRENPRVGRWEVTDDVLQNTMIRLHRSLADVKPKSARELFGLTRLQFTRELTDLARKHYGPQGIGHNHATDYRTTGSTDTPHRAADAETNDPARLADWLEFHEAIEGLDEPVREVFQMSWYRLMTHEEMATALGVSTKTIQRRFRDACVELQRRCHSIPGEN
jgi:RNA polymerase sigma-70 factor (ECF subfamily)